MTTQPPPSTPVALTPVQQTLVDEVAAVQVLGIAALSEGFCPFCYNPLTPLTDDERARCAGWHAPPSAACRACQRAVGGYPDGSGITVNGVLVGGYYGTALADMRPHDPAHTDGAR